MKKNTFLTLRKINKGLLLLHCGSWIQNLLFKLFSRGESFVSMTSEEAEKLLSEKHNDVKSSAICENKITSQNVDLQIVIPVYKAELFLRKCIDSILNQKTKYSFKIVAVNDGSPDKSGDILREYESDERVIVYTQENRGHAGARNTALKEIFAKYITFVDSDDEMPQGAIDAMLNAAFENDADIVQGSMDDKTLSGVISCNYTNQLDTNAPKSAMKGFPCGKLFRSELFKYICFPEKYWFEDSNIGMLIVPRTKHLVTIPDVVYYYVENPNSITHTHVGKSKTIDSFYVTRALLADQKKLLDTGEVLDYPIDYMFNQIAINWHRTFLLGVDVESAIFVLTCEMFNKRFPNPTSYDSKYKNLCMSLIDKNFAIYRRECAFL